MHSALNVCGAGARTLLAALALAAGAAAAEEPERLGFAGFSGSNTLLRRLGGAMSDALLVSLRRDPALALVERADLAALLGPERVAELADCPAEASTCPVGPAARLDFAWLLAGRLSGGPRPRRLEVWLVRASDGRVVWRNGRRLPNAPAPPEFAEGLGKAVLQVAVAHQLPILVAEGYQAVVAEPSFTGNFPDGAWLPVILGTGTLIAGGFLAYDASVSWGKLHSDAWLGQNTAAAIKAENDHYTVSLAVSLSLLGVGAVGLGGGLLWMVLGGAGTPPSLPPVTVLPGPGGLLVSGRW